jgi:glutamyl-Q tRNA(Asp) synthetase
VRYVGRFAPSPTGPLHLGSLTTAVASYLHARQADGRWLLRIEDIDPPREVPGAGDDILRTLEAFDLEWDGPVLYQSRRRDIYQAAAEGLLLDDRAFRCSCSRSTLRETTEVPGRYPGTCRTRTTHDPPTAVRVRVDPGLEQFSDGLQGEVATDLAATTGDYLIWRRDDLPAYHLAVVVDDASQGVTTVVRGRDLLETTAVHLHLQRTLGLPTPQYLHTPIVLSPDGQKLSKQTGAAPIDTGDRAGAAARVLALLGVVVPEELRGATPRALWSWALGHWNVADLQGRQVWSAEAAAGGLDGPNGPACAPPA